MNRKGSRLLVVDNDDGVRRFCQVVLGAAGYEVLTAEGVEAAVRHFRAGVPVRAVLTDVQMGPEDGWSLVEWLKAHYPLCPVAMMSAARQPRWEELGRKSGISGLILKPFSADALVSFVRSSLP